MNNKSTSDTKTAPESRPSNLDQSSPEHRDPMADGPSKATGAAVDPLMNSGRNPNGTFRPGNEYAFPPGRSGNPKGRPKSMRLMTNRLRSNMQTPFPNDPAGRNFGEVIIDNLSLNAVRGDFRSLSEVLNRLEGSSQKSAPEKDSAYEAELWTRIASQLLAECKDNPDARRAILAAVDKIEIEDD